MKTLRLLTSLRLANFGACLFTASLLRALQKLLPDYDVRALDYSLPQWEVYEVLRALRFHRAIPFYNLRRYQHCLQFYRDRVPMDRPVRVFPLRLDDQIARTGDIDSTINRLNIGLAAME